MKILTRYILKEFLIPLFYCLVGFVSIYVLFELFGSFSRMLGSNISILTVVEYLCGYLAPYFHYLAPAAMMLATLYTMWSFCRNSEIIAMRASGVSFLEIVKPLLFVAFLMAGFVAWINEDYMPRKAHWAAQVKNEHFDLEKIAKADNVVYRNKSGNRIWNVDEIVDGNASTLKNVRVTVDREKGGRLISVTAPKAEYLDGEWWFIEPKIQHYDEKGQEIRTPTPELDALTMRCFPEFSEKPNDFLMQNRPWRFNSIKDRFAYIKQHPEMTEKMKDEYRYDAWAQIMSPFACIIITLFAIPAGIASGRQSVFRGILGALGLFFGYYALTIGFMIVAKNSLCNPVFAAVVPSIVFLALGIRAFLKQR